MTLGRSESDDELPRRHLLTLVGTTAGVALAGCSNVTSQSFSASPVVLTEADQEELRIAETARDTQTITQSGPADSEVEITNQAAIYSRANSLGGE